MGNIKRFRQEKWKKVLKRNKGNIIVLAIILLVSCFFISKKEGYHLDEMLSFELSNAEFTPWIVPTQPEGRLEKFVQNEIYGDSIGETFSNILFTVKDVLKNRGASKMLTYQADVFEEPVWISAQQFKDYITTRGHDRFNYISVYFNVKGDPHPPLYYMALHTVSSLFPEKISPWMGCMINLIWLLGICVLLMKICRGFLGNKELGWAACILYACSMAGIATVLLIRMYAMLTFFCMAALWLHLEKMRSGQWEKHNGLLILVTVCGFLTQYYFVIFMLFLAGVSIVYILKRYDRKAVFYYIRTMGISAVVGLCIFPFSVEEVLQGDRGIEAVQNLGGGFSGLGERLLSFMLILKEEVFSGTMGLGIFLLVIVAAFVVWILAKFSESSELAAVKKKEREKRRKSEETLSYLYFMAGIPMVGYFLVVVKIAPYYVDRYLMPIFPLLALFMAIMLMKSLDYLKQYLSLLGKKGILTAFAVLIVLPNMKLSTPEYLYRGYDLQVAMSEERSDTACLCVYNGVGYYENLPEFTNYKKTLLVTPEELVRRAPDQVLEEEDRLVVIYKNNSDPEKVVKSYLADQYGFQFSQFVLRDTVHGDMVVLYEKQEGI